MIIASLEYIHKYIISLYENDFFSKGKMQIHVGATLYIYIVHECNHSTFTNKNSNTPRLVEPMYIKQ